MFGRKRKADWKRSCAELQRQHDALAKQHDALAKQHDGLAKKYDALNVRYNGVNQEIGELRAWIKGIEKRVNDLQEQARLAGRKKVRRRDPQTGRFESVYEDELESE